MRDHSKGFQVFFSGRDNTFGMLARLRLLSPGAWPDLRESTRRMCGSDRSFRYHKPRFGFMPKDPSMGLAPSRKPG